MSRKFKLVTPVLTAVLGLALLVGCGGKGDKQEAAPKPQAAETQKPAPPHTPDAANGKSLYLQTCAACHGPDAKGLPNLGKDLTRSKFVSEKTDAELVEFVKQGRGPSDPLNTTGIAMPPKGGNPSLKDADIQDIIAYIRTIHVQDSVKTNS